jgi:hypothetical protein
MRAGERANEKSSAKSSVMARRRGKKVMYRDDDFRWHVGVILLLLAVFSSIHLLSRSRGRSFKLLIFICSTFFACLRSPLSKLLYYFHSTSRIEISCFYLRFLCLSRSSASLVSCHLGLFLSLARTRQNLLFMHISINYFFIDFSRLRRCALVLRVNLFF